jgi:hypothetical protein
MKNWTDSCINWNQLPGVEVKRLLATWGKDEKFIAKYDKAHGFAHSPLSVAPVKTEPKADTAPVKKAPAKKVVAARQRHTGADGEIKFVEHRNLYIGFFGGRVVVTKRTREACAEYLKANYGVEA